MEKMAHLISFKTPRKVRLTTPTVYLILILFLGFFLRIYKIRDYIVFLGDEGRDALVVWGILHGDLTLLGPTASVGGFFLGPIYYYLMTPFLWLSNYDPVGPAVMVVLFGVATIYLVYRLTKEFFGSLAGLIAAFLYAISPIVIIYSRSSWNPNVFPFFTLATLYTLYKAVEKNKWWLFVCSGLLMGINLQIHYLATFVGAVMFFYILLDNFKPNIGWAIATVKNYLYTFIGFITGFLPFLMFEIRHEFKNSINIFNFIFNSSDTGAGQQLFSNIYNVFLRLFGGLVLNLPISNNFNNYNKNLIDVWIISSATLGLVSVIFFLFFFYRNRKDKTSFKKLLLIFIWGLVGIGLFGLYKKPIFDYYLGFLFPLPFILIGLFLSQLVSLHKKFGLITVSIFVAILVAINLKFTPIGRPGNQQVNDIKSQAEFILEITRDQPFNFALMSSGNSDHAYRYFFKLAGEDPDVIQNPDIDPERYTVKDQLIVVCDRSVPCNPLGYSLWEIAGFGRAEIDEKWNLPLVEVFRLIHYEGEEK